MGLQTRLVFTTFEVSALSLFQFKFVYKHKLEMSVNKNIFVVVGLSKRRILSEIFIVKYSVRTINITDIYVFFKFGPRLSKMCLVGSSAQNFSCSQCRNRSA